MVNLEDLPTGPDGSDWAAGMTAGQLSAMISDALLEAPPADIDAAIPKIEDATRRYAKHRRQRRYVLEVANVLGDIAEHGVAIARRLATG